MSFLDRLSSKLSGGSIKRRLRSPSNASSTSQRGSSLSRSPSPQPPVPNFVAPRSPQPPSPSRSQAHTRALSEPAAVPTITISEAQSGAISSAASTPAISPSQAVATQKPTIPGGWSGFKTLIKVLDSSSSAFPPLKSAVHGLHACIEIFENASRGRNEYVELFGKMDSLLGDLSGFISASAGSKMTQSMMELCTGLDKELKDVREKYGKSNIVTLEDSDRIMSSYRRIQGYLERLTMNANLSMWDTVNNLETEARLKALSPSMSAAYNSAEPEDEWRKECTPGTREEELATLLDWARDPTPQAEDVYWMNGMAGTGKTTIAYSLCAELAKSAELGASFFCSNLVPECRNVKFIIPSIAYQLARTSAPFRKALSEILQSEHDLQTRTFKTQFENLIFKPLAADKDKFSTKLVVVIDGLDECEHDESVKQFLDVLISQTRSSGLPVRFLVSSRPEWEISRQFSNQGAQLVLHEVGSKAVKQDIETFIQSELAEANLTSSQLSTLVELSGVLFAFASAMVRYIKEGIRFEEHEDRLNAVLGLSSGATEKNREIDEMYTSVLQRVLAGKPNQTRLKMILQAVVCAREPMTVNGLAGLLGLGEKQVDASLRHLASIINISQSTELVTTLHASFAEFMLDQERSLQFHCDPPAIHTQMSQRCFQAIKNISPQFNICALESSYIRDDEVLDLSKRSKEMILPHALYACRNWVAHLRLGGQSDQIGDLLWDFLSARLLLWMEILNITKCMHLGPRMLKRAESWCRTNNLSEETVALAHDAWRFVVMFASHSVSQSTPHIYVSMLPFWPKASPIAQHYFKQTEGAIQPQGTALTRRRLDCVAIWPFDAWPVSTTLSSDWRLIALGRLSSVFILDTATREVTLGPLAHDDWVLSIAWSADDKLIASGSEDKTVRVWSADSGKAFVDPLVGHSGPVSSVCFFQDNSRIVSGSHDSSIRVWSLRNGGEVILVIPAHSAAVLSVCVSPNDTQFASGSKDHTVRLWHAETGDEVLGPLVGHTGPVKSVRFSPDGAHIASASYDKTVQLWSIGTPTSTQVKKFQGHTDEVYCVEFSPDGKHIVSGGHDHTIRIWDTNGNPESSRVLEGHMNDVYSIDLSSDGTCLVSSSLDWTIRLWDVSNEVLAENPLPGHTKAVLSVSFSNDGDRIISSSIDATVCVWDAQNGGLALGPLRGHVGFVHTACFSPDGTQIVSSSEDHSIRMWDAKSGDPVGKPLNGHTDGVLSACFSPDGTLIVSGSKDKTIRIWSAKSQDMILGPLTAHTDWVRPVYFLPNGSKLASGGADNTILLWDVKSGERLISPLQGHTGPVMAISISPDGAAIASGSTDMTIRLWNTESGQSFPAPLRGHTSRVKFLNYSPDGQHIVSGSDDKTLRLWNTKTGGAIGGPLIGHTMGIHCSVFSPNGKLVVSGSQDRSIRVWDVTDLVGAQDTQEPDLPAVPHGPIMGHSREDLIYQEDGWISDRKSHLLAWVPPDLCPGLMHPRNTILISAEGSLRLNMEDAKLGELWTESYKL